MSSSFLTAEQLASFDRDGFLLLRAFFSSGALSALSSAVDALVARFEALGACGVGVFEVAEQARAASDAYFLASGDTVVPFLEPAATVAGSLRPGVAIRDALNKAGHALHCEPGAFRDAVHDGRVAAVCRSLGYAAPAVPQSMVIFKPARLGGAVPPHVDGAFLHTTPQSVLGFWTPLTAATTDNGCLWAVPGSHARAVRRVFHRNAAGTGTAWTPPDADAFDTAGAVPLEMAAGDLVLLHSALVHFSEANASGAARHAFTWHVVESGKGVVYDATNWLQRRDGRPFPRLYEEGA
jgi:phytanoyl-CoA hydroxylase